MNFHFAFRLERMALKQPAGAGAAQKVLLIGRFVVRVARRKHHSLDAQVHHLIEKVADAVRIGAIEEGCVGGDAEAARDGFTDAFDGEFEAAFLANREVVMLFFAVDVHRKGQVLTGFEEVQLLFEQERVGAEIDVLFAGDESFDDFVDFRVHQRFPARNRYHRGAAFVDSLEALLRAHIHFENVRRILDLAATRACQIAAEEGFEHQHERIALVSRRPLAEHVAHNCPHLRDGNTHPVKTSLESETPIVSSTCADYASVSTD